MRQTHVSLVRRCLVISVICIELSVLSKKWSFLLSHPITIQSHRVTLLELIFMFNRRKTWFLMPWQTAQRFLPPPLFLIKADEVKLQDINSICIDICHCQHCLEGVKRIQCMVTHNLACFDLFVADWILELPLV